jgi:hypothetical protein
MYTSKTSLTSAAGIISRIMSETLGYSAAEIEANKPEDATMMELGLQLVDDGPEVRSIMEHAFATKEDASDFLNRIKNAPQLAPRAILGREIFKI